MEISQQRIGKAIAGIERIAGVVAEVEGAPRLPIRGIALGDARYEDPNLDLVLAGDLAHVFCEIPVSVQVEPWQAHQVRISGIRRYAAEVEKWHDARNHLEACRCVRIDPGHVAEASITHRAEIGG